MTVEQLVSKQQLEIEHYKSILENNEILKHDLHFKLCGIGQPLNDNCLEFNREQIKWCFSVLELIECLNVDYKNDEEDF